MPTWSQLLPELKERIASFLPGNDVAASLRLVDRAAAAQFRGPHHVSIRLSQPCCPDTFARHWRAPGATHGLTLTQRRRLLCLIAASGCVPNLKVAAAVAGCTLTPRVFRSAVEANQLSVCTWLLQFNLSTLGALSVAAAAGHRQACEWLLAHTPVSSASDVHAAAEAAARAGHVGLMEWLLRLTQQQQGEREPHKPGGAPEPAGAAPRATDRSLYCTEALLAHAARDCDLAALQRLYASRLSLEAAAAEAALLRTAGLPGMGLDEQAQGLAAATAAALAGRASRMAVADLAGIAGDAALAAAAASTTPDWQAKLEWLVSQHRAGGGVEGFDSPRPTRQAAAAAATLPDAPQRLAVLRALGCPVNTQEVVIAAARAGNVAALRYMRAELGASAAAAALRAAAFSAAKAGQLGALSYLAAEADVSMDGVALVAAEGGHAHVLQWLAEEADGGADGGAGGGGGGGGGAAAATACATLGTVAFLVVHADLPVVACLRELGCPMDWAAVEACRGQGLGGVLELPED